MEITHKVSRLFFNYSLLGFLDIYLFIISEWALLSEGFLCFLLRIEFKVMGQLIGLASVGVTSNEWRM